MKTKNFFKFIDFIALLAVIGFSLLVCDDNSSGDSTTTTVDRGNSGNGGIHAKIF